MYTPVSIPKSSSCDTMYEHNAVRNIISILEYGVDYSKCLGVGSVSKYGRMGSNVASF